MNKVPSMNANAVHIANISMNSSHKGGNTTTGGSPLEALPKQFVVSMKKLFDILDDQQSGFVKFSDIKRGWHDDGCKGLPRGVIDSLRKVTPASGLLSFERFCAGLKICLLRNQTNAAVMPPSSPVGGSKVKAIGLKPSRPPSAPLLEIENPLPNNPWNTGLRAAPFRPHNIMATHRTLSLPQLSPDSDCIDFETDMTGSVPSFNSPSPPPKPPRSATIAKAGGRSLIANGVAGTEKADIRNALQNWKMGVLLNEMDTKDKRKALFMQGHFVSYRGSADGGSSSATDSNPVNVYAKKSLTGKRREPRRHTLQNGVDYNMLRRLKQFEEERELLLLGLDGVEKTRDWYIQQIAGVQEKIQYLGRMGTNVDQWSEVQQERLNFQRASVLEVNRNLTSLRDTWERGDFPMHYSTAVPSNSSNLLRGAGGTASKPVDRLRQQNRYLTNEVNLKNGRIVVLEREKQALLRELFALRQHGSAAGCDDGELISVLSQSSPVCSSSSGGLGDADVVY